MRKWFVLMFLIVGLAQVSNASAQVSCAVGELEPNAINCTYGHEVYVANYTGLTVDGVLEHRHNPKQDSIQQQVTDRIWQCGWEIAQSRPNASDEELLQVAAECFPRPGTPENPENEFCSQIEIWVQGTTLFVSFPLAWEGRVYADYWINGTQQDVGVTAPYAHDFRDYYLSPIHNWRFRLWSSILGFDCLYSG